MTTKSKQVEVLPPTHPGEVLELEFLQPLGITHYRLAQDTGLSQTQVGEIVKGKRGITGPTALRLSRYFGTSEFFWANLQAHYDVEKARDTTSEALERIIPCNNARVM